VASFFISTAEQTTWSLDPAELARRVSAHWPGARVDGATDEADAYQLHWVIPAGPTPLEGKLDREGNGIVLEGDLNDAAEFAAWLAESAPLGPGLVFYDEGYTDTVPLRRGTPPQSFAAPFLA
jgi:hypothetical protein